MLSIYILANHPPPFVNSQENRTNLCWTNHGPGWAKDEGTTFVWPEKNGGIFVLISGGIVTHLWHSKLAILETEAFVSETSLGINSELRLSYIPFGQRMALAALRGCWSRCLGEWQDLRCVPKRPNGKNCNSQRKQSVWTLVPLVAAGNGPALLTGHWVSSMA